MSRRTMALLPLAAVVAVLGAADARAASVAVTTTIEGGVKGPDVTVYHLHFDAGAGEANDVTVAPATAGVRVRDAGAPVTPGNGCAAVDAHEVLCASTPNLYEVASRTAPTASRSRPTSPVRPPPPRSTAARATTASPAVRAATG